MATPPFLLLLLLLSSSASSLSYNRDSNEIPSIAVVEAEPFLDVVDEYFQAFKERHGK